MWFWKNTKLKFRHNSIFDKTLKKSSGKYILTPQQLMKCSLGSLVRSRNVFVVYYEIPFIVIIPLQFEIYLGLNSFKEGWIWWPCLSPKFIFSKFVLLVSVSVVELSGGGGLLPMRLPNLVISLIHYPSITLCTAVFLWCSTD